MNWTTIEWDVWTDLGCKLNCIYYLTLTAVYQAASADNHSFHTPRY